MGDTARSVGGRM